MQKHRFDRGTVRKEDRKDLFVFPNANTRLTWRQSMGVLLAWGLGSQGGRMRAEAGRSWAGKSSWRRSRGFICSRDERGRFTVTHGCEWLR